MPVIADRVVETTDVSGTSDAGLLGAATGYRAFSGAFSTNDQVYYVIVGSNGAEVEVGKGYLRATPSRIERSTATIYYSTNSNNLVNFSAGNKLIFNDVPAPVLAEILSGNFTQVAVSNAVVSSTVQTNSVQPYSGTVVTVGGVTVDGTTITGTLSGNASSATQANYL